MAHTPKPKKRPKQSSSTSLHREAVARLRRGLLALSEVPKTLRGAKRLARNHAHRRELENIARVAGSLHTQAAEVAAKLGGARHG
jgi:hypothetical protein